MMTTSNSIVDFLTEEEPPAQEESKGNVISRILQQFAIQAQAGKEALPQKGYLKPNLRLSFDKYGVAKMEAKMYPVSESAELVPQYGGMGDAWRGASQERSIAQANLLNKLNKFYSTKLPIRPMVSIDTELRKRMNRNGGSLSVDEIEEVVNTQLSKIRNNREALEQIANGERVDVSDPAEASVRKIAAQLMLDMEHYFTPLKEESLVRVGEEHPIYSNRVSLDMASGNYQPHSSNRHKLAQVTEVIQIANDDQVYLSSVRNKRLLPENCPKIEPSRMTVSEPRQVPGMRGIGVSGNYHVFDGSSISLEFDEGDQPENAYMLSPMEEQVERLKAIAGQFLEVTSKESSMKEYTTQRGRSVSFKEGVMPWASMHDINLSMGEHESFRTMVNLHKAEMHLKAATALLRVAGMRVTNEKLNVSI